jgi:hypothetical protein
VRVTVGGLALDLTDAQVEELREQLGSIGADTSGGMLTTAQAAERLGFSPEYVRDHAVELGGVKLTDSPKAEWRFDSAKLGANAKRVAHFDVEKPSTSPRRRAARRAGSGQLLKARR